ncbi:MAG: hypothetical protein SGILL_000864 [Bacillariaceae sp.]
MRDGVKVTVTLLVVALAAISVLFIDFAEYDNNLSPTTWASSLAKHQYYNRNFSNCTVISPKSFNNSMDLYKYVHRAEFPAMQAGQWTYRPEHADHPTQEHLRCLSAEVQGNCHHSKWIKDQKSRQRRHDKMQTGQIVNSEGILHANDPWVWESDREAYKVLPFCLLHNAETADILFANNRTIYLLGDSLTRQWWQSMRCDAQYSFGMTQEKANQAIQFHQEYMQFPNATTLGHFLRDSTPHDYFVFNFGHHPDPAKLGDDWAETYIKILKEAFLTSKFGKIPSHHVFFRTTSVRHFLYGKGDWNTSSSASGGASANMNAQWKMYGGLHPAQPEQNLIAFDLFSNLTSSYDNIQVGGILDTSPMMLARADATYDGSHFCLPGPVDYWSRMLFYRIYTEEMEKV